MSVRSGPFTEEKVRLDATYHDIQGNPMTSTLNSMALKEWAAVCGALAQGTQAVLFRKGGIHEGPEGFRPEHSVFWLFPTGFHQSADGVRPEFADATLHLLNHPREPATIPIQFYSRIRAVHWIQQERCLTALQPFHILTDEAIRKRFHYRQPGLFALVVETRQLPEPVAIPADPRYDGCHSWVTLNDAISTRHLLPLREEVSLLAARAEQALSEIA